MTEAVIVATARSPIGRANKGSLVDLRPDDMSAQIVKALMAKVPQVKATDVDDLMMGIGQPAGEGGFNIARVVAVLAGLDDVPGVTVNRYCSSSLQTIRMAFHAIKAGEGDCFIAAGVETVSRYASGASDLAPNAIFKEAGARTKERSQGGQGAWTPPTGLPDIYIAMGQTAENVREVEGVTREEMDAFAKLSQDRASANVANGFFEAEITPLTLPDGTVVSKDDCPREGTRRIGCTIFETDRLPAGWARECNRMDEVWVPSEFNRGTFAASGVDATASVRVSAVVSADARAWWSGMEVRRVEGLRESTALPNLSNRAMCGGRSRRG